MNYQHHNQAILRAEIEWAKQLLETDFLIFDSETDGLSDPDIVQLAVINKHRHVLLNCMLKPTRRATWEGAEAIHHISPAMVRDCPVFEDVLPMLTRLFEGQQLVIYNAGYDWGQILQPLAGAKLNPQSVTCAMEHYAGFYGEWNNYRRNYKWQKLPGGDHTALGDCLATLDLIERMATEEIVNVIQLKQIGIDPAILNPNNVLKED